MATLLKKIEVEVEVDITPEILLEALKKFSEKEEAMIIDSILSGYSSSQNLAFEKKRELIDTLKKHLKILNNK
jgi:hypothetical protein